MSTTVVMDPILVSQAASKLTGKDKTLLNKTTGIPYPNPHLLDPAVCRQTLSNNQWAKWFCRDAAHDAKRLKDKTPTYRMKGVWLQDFIEGPKNMARAKDAAQHTMREMSTWETLGGLFYSKAVLGLLQNWAPLLTITTVPGPNTPSSMGRSSDNLYWAAEEGEKAYFDGIQDSVLAKAMVAVQTLLHHIDIHKSPWDGHHGQKYHLLQYVKVDGTQDLEDPHEDGIRRSFIHAGTEYIYEDHTVASERTGARHLVHTWPDQAHDPIIHGLHPLADMVSNAHGALHVHAYFEDTQELAILLGEMFHVSFPAFYAKYEAAFLTGHWMVTDPGFDVTIHWSPGHEGIHGNKHADKEAKLAATGKRNNSKKSQLPHYLRQGILPLSISAIKQAHSQLTHARWTRLWTKSPRHAYMQCLDPQVIRRSFIKLNALLPKHLTGLLMNLRSKHIPLNKHLHRIHKAASPMCPHCLETEEHGTSLPIRMHSNIAESAHILQCNLGRDTSFHPPSPDRLGSCRTHGSFRQLYETPESYLRSKHHQQDPVLHYTLYH
ncbi:uncharacterized protein EDB91DRAFT_1245125 [Suillus paluster]|uniref:uncharacterized protein n=1 Tax=Suillus paluster TaxID=48578 RepID=UPI001B87F51A|nr:uncharacterized protein EDB91DRAFT_1245125 [Suillus paluster]KAG1748425.1 hypothetical protein EDB91DRAFT_1245125 [Suillus paluster]